MLNVHHIAAFSNGGADGNPAGVVICDPLPDPAVMQRVAAAVGYSESVFAAPVGDGWRVRYFAPEVEVDFCGHATIALGAALARHAGPGYLTLDINRARITIEGHLSGTARGASFQSPPSRSAPVAPAVLDDALALFGLTFADLDPRISPAVAHGGRDHLVLAVKDREILRAMRYDVAKGRALAEREGYITFNLVYAETAQLIHARNPFPLGGVTEDTATGAAAAALAGYLRDLGWPHGGSITIRQGEDMGGVAVGRCNHARTRCQHPCHRRRPHAPHPASDGGPRHDDAGTETGSAWPCLAPAPDPLAVCRPVRQVGTALVLR
ncbi:PhzF family phenazine biosynthesis protein [Roseovarius ramblicola]|uniref:PhzF family phenazine biosynthesis protein n=1 Tax=Roseovarius ramblicola TaxID=2022336 RepID=A0ABV5I553_9RHOB